MWTTFSLLSCTLRFIKHNSSHSSISHDILLYFCPGLKREKSEQSGAVSLQFMPWVICGLCWSRKKWTLEASFYRSSCHHLPFGKLERSRAGNTSNYAKLTKWFHVVSRFIKLISIYKSNNCTGNWQSFWLKENLTWYHLPNLFIWSRSCYSERLIPHH